MPTDVVMPQMGESVAEGTIVRWIKSVGDAVGKDEPLFEISTDKVDAEIPSPEEGVLLEIRVKEGDTVPVHTVVAVIGGTGAEDARDSRTTAPEAEAGRASIVRSAAPVTAGASARSSAPAAVVPSANRGPAPATPVRPASPPPGRTGPSESRGDGVAALPRVRRLSSPVVRNIAREHNIDLTQLAGTGIGGRVTRRDIERVVEQQVDAPPVANAARGSVQEPDSSPETASASAVVPEPATYGPNARIEKMSVMRRKIAERMVASVRTSPHVYSAYEVDFTRIDELRGKYATSFEQNGARLTYTAFIARATALTLREFPFANASLDADHTIIYRGDINIGVAVALERGLIVPVIRNADERSLVDLCRAIQDLAARARSKQLKVEEVEAGTFTITNPGIFGGLWGLPILSQPQVAILAVGSIEKRAVVRGDDIVARRMCYLTMGYDHRLIDGADGGRFLQALKERLEGFADSELHV